MSLVNGAGNNGEIAKCFPPKKIEIPVLAYPEGTDTNESIMSKYQEIQGIEQKSDAVYSEIEAEKSDSEDAIKSTSEQLEQMANAVADAQNELQVVTAAADTADSAATSAESNASALAAYANSLSPTKTIQNPVGIDENGKTIYETKEVENPEYAAAQEQAKAAQEQAEALRQQANQLKEQEAQVAAACNDIADSLAELKDGVEDLTSEQESALNELLSEAEELNTQAEDVLKEIEQEEAKADENTASPECVDNGDGTTTVTVDGKEYTVSKDENGNPIIVDSEGNTTSYDFSTTADGQTVLNGTTTKNSDGSTTNTSMVDGNVDISKTNKYGRTVSHTYMGKDNEVKFGTFADPDTGIRTTVDEKGKVTYTDSAGRELTTEQVRKYEEKVEKTGWAPIWLQSQPPLNISNGQESDGIEKYEVPDSEPSPSKPILPDADPDTPETQTLELKYTFPTGDMRSDTEFEKKLKEFGQNPETGKNTAGPWIKFEMPNNAKNSDIIVNPMLNNFLKPNESEVIKYNDTHKEEFGQNPETGKPTPKKPETLEFNYKYPTGDMADPKEMEDFELKEFKQRTEDEYRHKLYKKPEN